MVTINDLRYMKYDKRENALSPECMMGKMLEEKLNDMLDAMMWNAVHWVEVLCSGNEAKMDQLMEYGCNYAPCFTTLTDFVKELKFSCEEIWLKGTTLYSEVTNDKHAEIMPEKNSDYRLKLELRDTNCPGVGALYTEICCVEFSFEANNC